MHLFGNSLTHTFSVINNVKSCKTKLNSFQIQYVMNEYYNCFLSSFLVILVSTILS